MEGNLHIEWFRRAGWACEVLSASFSGAEQSFPGVWAFQQEVGRWVFGAFAGAQPTAGDAEKFCKLVESPMGTPRLNQLFTC